MRGKWKDQSVLWDFDSDSDPPSSIVLCFFQPATEQLGEAERAWLKGVKKKVDSCSISRSREVIVKGRISGSGSLLSLKRESSCVLFCNAWVNKCLVRKALTNSVININFFGLGGWLAYPCRIITLIIKGFLFLSSSAALLYVRPEISWKVRELWMMVTVTTKLWRWSPTP